MRNNVPQRSLVLFDLDGTLTYKDSLFDFIEHAVGKRRFYLGLLAQSINLVAFKLGLLKNDVAKQRLFSHFFKGINVNIFSSKADNYASEYLSSIIRHDALDCLDKHIQQGHDVYIVSASIEHWIAAWCQDKGVKLIGTKIEIRDDIVSGRFSSPNCHGMEKVNRIRAEIDTSDYATIIAYGDSSGDDQMLELADKAFMRHFTGKG